MSSDTLLNNLDGLRALVARLASERDAAIASRRLSEQNDQLWHLLKQLQRAQFGRQSERLDPGHIQLALEDTETARVAGGGGGEDGRSGHIGRSREKKRRNGAITAVRCRHIFPAYV